MAAWLSLTDSLKDSGVRLWYISQLEPGHHHKFSLSHCSSLFASLQSFFPIIAFLSIRMDITIPVTGRLADRAGLLLIYSRVIVWFSIFVEFILILCVIIELLLSGNKISLYTDYGSLHVWYTGPQYGIGARFHIAPFLTPKDSFGSWYA